MPMYVGTSGWQYADWRGLLYPAGLPSRRWLERYGEAFATVENNNAFYRLPRRETFEDWRARTPEGFVMAVKASRFLTHIKRLKDPEEPVRRLLGVAEGLGDKLGPVLLQLPPTFRADPARLDVRGELRCGSDVEIDIDCIFEGRVVLGDGVRVGSHCVIRDTTIGAGTEVLPHCDFTRATIGERVQIGPFARLRPGADLGAEVHIGNFVEVKNSRLERGSKANHLAYLGDTSVGERVNYGAGSITANYDGANKHRTVIGNDVHVGSNCVLVAPVTIGDGATIGAGSVINKNAPAGQLTVARARQASLDNWKRPIKQKKT